MSTTPNFRKDLERQRLDEHRSLLLDWCQRQGYQNVKIGNLSADEIANVDFVLSGKTGAIQRVREVECKTDSHEPVNLALELITNVPASFLSALPSRCPTATGDEGYEDIKNVCRKVKSGEIRGTFGLGLTPLADNHLLSYYYPKSSTWLLYDTRKVQEVIKAKAREYKLTVTVSDGSWGSVCCLIPIDNVQGARLNLAQ